MTSGRYSVSRQKSCLSCATAKARCDRSAGACTRCSLRNIPCSYPETLTPGHSTVSQSNNLQSAFGSRLPAPDCLSATEHQTSMLVRGPSANVDHENGHTQSPNDDCSPNRNSGSGQGPALGASRSTHRPQPRDQFETLQFSTMGTSLSKDLFCPIDADAIRNRWLNPYIPVPGQKRKEYPAAVAAFVYRMLKSFAAVTVRGRGVPPFMHHAQMSSMAADSPLSTCLTLVRICDTISPGSEGVAVDVLQREMNNLHERHAACDDVDLLASFQAYLIYSMVLFFVLNQGPGAALRQTMMNLQELACACSKRGLMCIAEQQRTRPRWESWVVAEAKRRTLFTIYMFDSILTVQEGLPGFIGIELTGLPTPANQTLWRAETKHEWEMAYNVHLVDWQEDLRIEELWPPPPHLNDNDLDQRRRRVDRWLENIDEFGTMLYAVTSCTHGG